ncbi:MAG: molybdenum cofactor biosynthesis protein MoaE [Anaerolineales bacterium]|nr:molybdenum cofactor biosynthesis protein MoaE [Anaerolineales bacterium]
MNVKILFFATMKDKSGTDLMPLELSDNASVADLKTVLGEQMPALETSLPTAVVSVNREFAFPEDQIPPDAEVGIFPPVSGGQKQTTMVEVRTDPINIDELTKQIVDLTTGAVCVFSGIVRAHTKQSKAYQHAGYTKHLEYEAYVPMAKKKMRQVSDEIRANWPQVTGISIVQRIGILDPGTPTVVIACAGSHRDSCIFEAARYGIDRLKEIVPIWKKEIGPEGTSWVHGKYQPTVNDQGQSFASMVQKKQ